MKYQNYNHYKLPITINPLEYGKLILKILELNLFVVQINKTNIAVIKQFDNLNKVKLFKLGDFLFEYTDFKTSENSFVRTIDNRKFTFNKSILTSIEKIINSNRLIFALLLICFYYFDNSILLQLAVIPFKNIIKLRKVNANHNWEDLVFYIKNKIFSQTLF